MSKKNPSASNEYQIRPKQREKFKAAEGREIIRGVLKEKLDNLTSNP